MYNFLENALEQIISCGGCGTYGRFNERHVLKFEIGIYLGQVSWWQNSGSLNIECIDESGAEKFLSQFLDITQSEAEQEVNTALQQLGVNWSRPKDGV